MSMIAAQVLQQVLDDIALSNTQQKWLTRQQTAGLQQKLPGADGIAFTGGAARNLITAATRGGSVRPAERYREKPSGA